MKLWYQVDDKWNNEFYGNLPKLKEPIDQIIASILRKEVLGKIQRPFWLTCSEADEKYISENLEFRRLFSPETDLTFLILQAASYRAQITKNKNELIWLKLLGNPSDPKCPLRWGIYFGFIDKTTDKTGGPT